MTDSISENNGHKKVKNITSGNGKKIANQFIITEGCNEYFQSYDSMIVFKTKVLVTKPIFKDGKCIDTYTDTENKIYLDSHYWNYSKTTAKYRNQFLNETTKETQKKIDSGEYILTNLN